MAIVKRKDKFVPSVKQRTYYSDIPSSFAVQYGTKDLNPEENEEAVKQSIVNLLLTNRGERLFKPLIGSDLRAMLFENMDSSTESTIRDFVKSTIKNFEPRAQVLEITTFVDPDQNAVAVTVVFSMINKTEPVTLNVLLNRIR